jgi:DNA-binding transcriptional MerR regulator
MTEQLVLPEGQESFKLNEVCKMANVQPYMLRFWGQEFPLLDPGKSGTGQRTFRRDQVELILEIKHLLFDEGLTIAGARKRLENAGGNSNVVAEMPPAPKGDDKSAVVKKKATTRKRAVSEPAAERIEKQKVDKPPVENVQPLLATLREIRGELTDVVAELKIN